MSRIIRNKITTNYIHIIVQGINKKFIFEDDYLKNIYLKLLLENIKNTSIVILAYCIMGNHTHLLMYVEKIDELISLMHKVNTVFALKYNKLTKRSGICF